MATADCRASSFKAKFLEILNKKALGASIAVFDSAAKARRKASCARSSAASRERMNRRR